MSAGLRLVNFDVTSRGFTTWGTPDQRDCGRIETYVNYGREMTTRYSDEDWVWVPAFRVGEGDRFALARRQVRDTVALSVVVDGVAGAAVKIGTRLVHGDGLGFLILRVGDWVSEATLLDPLAKSVLQYLRLLVPDDRVQLIHVRTRDEIGHALTTYGSTFSHVILVGHGSSTSLSTTDGGISGAEFGTKLDPAAPKVVVSLACYSGREAFARPISLAPGCREYVAPFSAAHGAAASHFVQTILHLHLLLGREFQASFRSANALIEGTHFRHWRNGHLRT